MTHETSSLSSKLSDHSSSACSINSDTDKFNHSTNTTSFDPSTSSKSKDRFKAMLGNTGRMSTAVTRSKLMVYLVLIVAAIGFGVAVHTFLEARQQQEFETQVRSSEHNTCLVWLRIVLNHPTLTLLFLFFFRYTGCSLGTLRSRFSPTPKTTRKNLWENLRRSATPSRRIPRALGLHGLTWRCPTLI